MRKRILTMSIGGGLDGGGVVVCSFCIAVAGLSSVSVRRGTFGGVNGACS